MNRVAVFGNTSAGKSTLSRKLSEITGIPWFPLDRLQFKPGGEEVPNTEFTSAHDDLLQQEKWIIDGFGSMGTFWERLDVADTLIYLDLPVLQHYWWVTKRMVQSIWVLPEGWPEGSPLLRGALKSYSTVWLCHTKLTPRYRSYVAEAQATKTVFHLRSPQEIKHFLKTISTEFSA